MENISVVHNPVHPVHGHILEALHYLSRFQQVTPGNADGRGLRHPVVRTSCSIMIEGNGEES